MDSGHTPDKSFRVGEETHTVGLYFQKPRSRELIPKSGQEKSAVLSGILPEGLRFHFSKVSYFAFKPPNASCR